MKTFDEYDAFVDESGRSEAPHAEKVAYAALKLNGEAGEVAELVGKSMRAYSKAYAQGGDLDPVKLALELGDVLWYVGRLAALHGFSLGDVARLNYEKLLRRRTVGKDAAGELETARRTLETRRAARERNFAAAVADMLEERALDPDVADHRVVISLDKRGDDYTYASVVDIAVDMTADAVVESVEETTEQQCKWCFDELPAGFEPFEYCSLYCYREATAKSPAEVV